MENEPIITSAENTGTASSVPPSQPFVNKDELKDFYTKGVPQILKTILTEPISGTYSLFKETSAKTYFNALVLIASTAVLYTLIIYMMMGDARQYLGFSAALKTGLMTVILMLMVSVVSFAVKSISGKPVFKNELLTGGLCGIPLLLFLLLLVLVKIFASNSNMMYMVTDPGAMLENSIVYLIVVLYLLLMLINILQQSFKAGGTRDALAWYLSPVGILLSFYLTYKIGYAILS